MNKIKKLSMFLCGCIVVIGCISYGCGGKEEEEPRPEVPGVDPISFRCVKVDLKPDYESKTYHFEVKTDPDNIKIDKYYIYAENDTNKYLYLTLEDGIFKSIKSSETGKYYVKAYSKDGRTSELLLVDGFDKFPEITVPISKDEVQSLIDSLDAQKFEQEKKIASNIVVFKNLNPRNNDDCIKKLLSEIKTAKKTDGWDKVTVEGLHYTEDKSVDTIYLRVTYANVN